MVALQPVLWEKLPLYCSCDSVIVCVSDEHSAAPLLGQMVAADGVATTGPSVGDPVGDGDAEECGDVEGDVDGDADELGCVDGELLGEVVVTSTFSVALFLCLSVKTIKHVPAPCDVILALYFGPLPLAGDTDAMPLHEAAVAAIEPL